MPPSLEEFAASDIFPSPSFVIPRKTLFFTRGCGQTMVSGQAVRRLLPTTNPSWTFVRSLLFSSSAGHISIQTSSLGQYRTNAGRRDMGLPFASQKTTSHWVCFCFCFGEGKTLYCVAPSSRLTSSIKFHDMVFWVFFLC